MKEEFRTLAKNLIGIKSDTNINWLAEFFGLSEGQNRFLYVIGLRFITKPLQNIVRFATEGLLGTLEILTRAVKNKITVNENTPSILYGAALSTRIFLLGIENIFKLSRYLVRTMTAPVESFQEAWNFRKKDRILGTFLAALSVTFTLVGYASLFIFLAPVIAPKALGGAASWLGKTLSQVGAKLSSFVSTGGHTTRAIMIPEQGANVVVYLASSISFLASWFIVPITAFSSLYSFGKFMLKADKAITKEIQTLDQQQVFKRKRKVQFPNENKSKDSTHKKVLTTLVANPGKEPTQKNIFLTVDNGEEVIPVGKKSSEEPLEKKQENPNPEYIPSRPGLS